MHSALDDLHSKHIQELVDRQQEKIILLTRQLRAKNEVLQSYANSFALDSNDPFEAALIPIVEMNRRERAGSTETYQLNLAIYEVVVYAITKLVTNNDF